ncbi:MAG: sulfatase [Polyangiaceae bacterium]
MRRCLVLLPALAAFGCSKGPSSPNESAGAPPAVSVPAASSEAPGPGPAAAPTQEPTAKVRPPYNVLFILIDSLRWDMPWTGYPRPIAPWLDAFAKRSTLYPRGYSISSYTAKSVAPALVGKYPSEMQRDAFFFTTWGPENLFFSERAQKLGHHTLAGHGHGYFKSFMGLNQGFDDYRLLPGTELDVRGVENITSEALNQLAKTMLSVPKNVSQENGKRFFAYFHFLDPHYTYFQHKDHPDWGLDIRALYDNEVHYTDKWVGDLVDWAEKQPWGKDTAIVISADHGEGFGERGRFRHAYDVWESLVRVPLVIHVPGAEPRRIETPRGHIDLAPTFAELMGVPDDPPFRGKSLVSEVFGGPTPLRPVVVDLPRSDIMDRRRAVIDERWKIIELGNGEEWLLFDVEKDPKEENDLSASDPERFAAMKELYEKLSSEIPNEPIPGLVGLKGAPNGQRW